LWPSACISGVTQRGHLLPNSALAPTTNEHAGGGKRGRQV
jgi:hypothetical protein